MSESDYLKQLEITAKNRYKEKIASINGVDPYNLRKEDKLSHAAGFPDIGYFDIVNYLVYGKSAYTAEDFKAYKSLQAYNQFACGWVSDVLSLKINSELCLVLGKVKHSQRLSEKPLEPWIIAEQKGRIKSAHCTCMAGLGEACTHVAALMFFVENEVRKKENVSVTSVPAYWKKPKNQAVPFCEVKDINFSTAKKNQSCNNVVSCNSMSKLNKTEIPKLSDKEFNSLLEELKEENPAILNISSQAMGKKIIQKSSLLLKQLFEEGNLKKSLKELQDLAMDVILTISNSDVTYVEKVTKLQAKSKEWFRFREGRITASNLKAACCTSIESPAMTIIKRICYPIKQKLYNKAIVWGCNHEKEAKNDFCKKSELTHKSFVCENSGFFINPEFPFLGASPDGLICCTCCGEGCLEIKCPYCLKDEANLLLKHKCLEMRNGKFTLSKKHSFYFQVQAQIFLSKRKYCDFVLWNKEGLFFERILPDFDFWNIQSKKAEVFFQKVILPELMGKAFTRQTQGKPCMVFL